MQAKTKNKIKEKTSEQTNPPVPWKLAASLQTEKHR